MTSAFTESTVEFAALRDVPLPKLVSSGLRVKDAERVLERAMT
jgi:hypothetical protein